MRGCLKFVLAMVMVCLLAITGAGIYGLFWVNRHLYTEQPIAIVTPEIDALQKAKLIKLFPLKSFFSAQSKKSSVEVSLSQAEADWVANHYLSEKKPEAKIKLAMGENRLSVKYCQKITEKKFFNLMLDTGLVAEKGNFRVNLERLQVGDYLVPVTFLGQFNYLVELYLSRGFGISGDGTVRISDLNLKDNLIKLVFVKI
jgi:hypothetical protein